MPRTETRSTFSVVNTVFGLLFLSSAALQYNDPDPWAWAALYAAAGVACFVGSRVRWVARVVLLAALAWAVWLAPVALPTFEFRDLARTMHADTPAIETSRELLGLSIIAGWMATISLRGERGKRG